LVLRRCGWRSGGFAVHPLPEGAADLEREVGCHFGSLDCVCFVLRGLVGRREDDEYSNSLKKVNFRDGKIGREKVNTNQPRRKVRCSPAYPLLTPTLQPSPYNIQTHPSSGLWTITASARHRAHHRRPSQMLLTLHATLHLRNILHGACPSPAQHWRKRGIPIAERFWLRRVRR
jgi:hypothetical protein